MSKGDSNNIKITNKGNVVDVSNIINRSITEKKELVSSIQDC